MSVSSSSIELVGNVGRVSELGVTKGGDPIQSFGLAVNRADQGADWFKVIVFGFPDTKLHTDFMDGVVPGTLVKVTGRPSSEAWLTPGGQTYVSKLGDSVPYTLGHQVVVWVRTLEVLERSSSGGGSRYPVIVG